VTFGLFFTETRNDRKVPQTPSDKVWHRAIQQRNSLTQKRVTRIRPNLESKLLFACRGFPDGDGRKLSISIGESY